MAPPTRADLARLDAGDPLAPVRARFSLPAGVIYLDGNSLGALPAAAAARVAEAVEGQWGKDLIRSWNVHGWIDAPRRLGARIAPLIGAEAHEVVVADSTTVNLFKLAAGALALRPGRTTVLAEAGNFPTDLHVLQGLETLAPGRMRLKALAREALLEALDEDVALVALTHVHYKSGERWPLAQITARAHEAGALMLWDLSHSAGALGIDLDAAGADLAVGCGYKYLNGGPGAPSYVFVAERLQKALRSPIWGWMGHAAPFEFGDSYVPAPGIGRQLAGTPGILGLAALEAGLDTFEGVDMRQVEAKAARMGDLLIELVEARCGLFGLALASPRDAAERGSHVSFAHPEGYAIMQALIARGVIGDFRAPDILRFGLTPLYLRYVDLWDAVEHLAAVLERGEQTQERFRRRQRVT
ncbi:MAG TPA: kynureninase [Caulobacteraceae bacterium]|jgi:kynureninase|nr:kynureninase [Caulobacteraceae bacterium]